MKGTCYSTVGKSSPRWALFAHGSLKSLQGFFGHLALRTVQAVVSRKAAAPSAAACSDMGVYDRRGTLSGSFFIRGPYDLGA